MRKAGLAVMVALFTYTIVDILIWQRIFEAHRMSYFAYLYHPGWYVVLFGEILLGAVLLLPNVRAAVFYAGALFSLAMCGLEDVLYYWLDGRHIPYQLPWLEINPWIVLKPVTATNLVLSAAIWTSICIVVYVSWCRHEVEWLNRHAGATIITVTHEIGEATARLAAPQRELPEALSMDLRPGKVGEPVPIRVAHLDQEF